MEKGKFYFKTKFSMEVLKASYEKFLSYLSFPIIKIKPSSLTIDIDNETWSYDTFEEFICAYKNCEGYRFDIIIQDKRLIMDGDRRYSYVKVCSKSRSEIEAIFQIFESKLDESIIKVEKEPLKIFIGHGHDNQWRDLKDHLKEKHGLDVIAYEIGPRAGLSIKEILESMLNQSSFALLVLTGEEVDSSGKMHARENVIHELGLFQGKIGFTRAIAILEKDVNEFSNILGVNQIRFSKGNIKETFGDILSTIKREFEEEGNKL